MISEFTKQDFRLKQGCGRPDTLVDFDSGKANSSLQRYVVETVALKRPLSVMCGATVVGITGEDAKTAVTGVSVRLPDGTLQEVKSPVVVVSGGSVGSARLLSASRGSVTVKESVGANFWDVPQVVLQYRTKDRSSHNCLFDPLVSAFLKADLRFSKPVLSLLSSYDDLMALWSPKAGAAPEATILFQPFTLNNDGTSPLSGEHGCQFVVRPLRPFSRGKVNADGTVDPNYFSAAGDLENLQNAVRYVKEQLVKKTPFIPIIGDLVGERLESSGINGGSCASVVDPTTFQVTGTDGLYLCDGSIIPGALSGNPIPYKLALADKFVDKLLKKKDVRRKVEDADAESGGSTRIVY
ncbi:choline dehydrogenase [Angomonas deanei]|uniref:GMC oxidoreductase, putative n=1 Tax=Angomonas deanei TaxID=59799 RepID=A0A7G2CMN7_9TRYP|nr:choline dehydrogenase [Angomonas deanei]CAD2221098.1 GMC oxidoreductase, putative [Angomonas deanei]|eukprot:EPY32573.1 choline dehydrogenase [Angomonas deanei]